MLECELIDKSIEPFSLDSKDIVVYIGLFIATIEVKARV